MEARLAASRLRICSLASSASFLALNREHSSSPTLISKQAGKVNVGKIPCFNSEIERTPSMSFHTGSVKYSCHYLLDVLTGARGELEKHKKYSYLGICSLSLVFTTSAVVSEKLPKNRKLFTRVAGPHLSNADPYPAFF